VGLIEDFIARYTKEYDFYDKAGRMAAQKPRNLRPIYRQLAFDL
jgi:hypothetical protein